MLKVKILAILTLILLSNISSAASDCNKLVANFIENSANTSKELKVIPQGLVTEINQKPQYLFINPSATGIGFDEAQLQVVKYFIENTKNAQIIIPSTERDLIDLADFDPAKKELIDFLISEQKAKRIKLNFLFKGNEFSIDSILWTRDYAPVKIFNKKTKEYELIGFRYALGTPKSEKDYKNGMRYTEDIQQSIADLLNLKLKKSDLVVEGGNMLSDTRGNVFISDKIIENNPGKSKEQIEKELLSLGFGEKIIWLTKIPNAIEPTGHVDLAIRFINETTVAVPKSTSKKLKPSLDLIAQEMEKAGYNVERFNMSSNIVDVVDGQKTIESPMNALQIENNLLIPKYGTKFDEQAKSFYESFGFKVEFATGETMKAAGSVHCMTYTY